MEREWQFELQLFAEEKTEEATPKRKEEARKKGQVAKSPELGLAAGILAACLLLKSLGSNMWRDLAGFTQEMLLYAGSWQGGQGDVQALVGQTILFLLRLLGPLFAGLLLVALAVNLAQVGFLWSTEGLVPKGNRINPMEGAKRIFSKRSLVELAKSIFKIVIVGYLAYSAVRKSFSVFLSTAQMPPLEGAAVMGGAAYQIGIRVGLGFLVLAVGDYFFQRFEHEKSIKMSREEVKEELKQAEGSPQTRSRIRQRQRQLAVSRMMEEVPRADVVITNPTHLAIALSYDPDKMAAPIVVAKGQNKLAEKIRELARTNNVPVIENKPLAQALYKTAEVGTTIPGNLYRAVAEILAFVYQLKGQSV